MPPPAGGTADGDWPRLGAEDPFLAPAQDRRTDRRLRGRLVAPVTVMTAGEADGPAGLTVSSVLVAEGEPPLLFALVDPLSAVYDRAATTGRIVVQVLGSGDERVAALFAGGYPVDPFEELEWSADPFGPVLAGERHVVRCLFGAAEPAGFQNLVRAEITSVDFAPGGSAPLAWYHGAYRVIGER